ncbi:MAG: hypothetical protein K5765_07370 [Clostridia bacterium]|nr:hypothetical protein [Clostridia bacterium]
MSKKNIITIVLLCISVLIIILGILFLFNAMQENPENGFFKEYCSMPSLLLKYIIVIATMACGIMMFSNVSLRFENKKLRNGLTIGITTFSTILTVPLVYVFIAIFPYHATGKLGPVGQFMGLDRIDASFLRWFNSPIIYVVFAVMLILSIIFITFPLITGILAVKGKTIKLNLSIADLDNNE